MFNMFSVLYFFFCINRVRVIETYLDASMGVASFLFSITVGTGLKTNMPQYLGRLNQSR